MRRIVVSTTVSSFTGCTILRPIEGIAPELQQRIPVDQVVSVRRTGFRTDKTVAHMRPYAVSEANQGTAV